MNKKVLIGVAAVAVILAIVLISNNTSTPTNESASSPKTSAPAPTSKSEVKKQPTIQEYVRENISKLSPEKEVLGGKFQVVRVTASGGKGVVIYEDGHNAFTADFKYVLDAEGAPEVTSFVVRK